MRNRKFVLIMVLAMVAALFITPAVAQEEDRWDGADDLPVNPLDCPVADGEMTEDEGDEEMMEMPEYNGGVAQNAPDKAGQDIVLVDIPKLIGIGYFDATALGFSRPLRNSATSP